MKPVKVSDLSGPALDWAVAKCEGSGDYWLSRWNDTVDRRFVYCQVMHNYSTNWSLAGPIIEREGISVHKYDNDPGWYSAKQGVSFLEDGSTPLIAAMRCYVASRLGDTVQIPEELL